MDPPENPHRVPDLFLTASSSSISDFYEVLDSLNHGDQIVFNATFESRDNNNDHPNRWLQLVNLNKTGLHNDGVAVYLSEKE